MKRGSAIGALTLGAAVVIAACGGGSGAGQPAGGKPALSGSVKVDGSSTVFPISEAMAEEFQKKNRNVRITVGISGTGGGFKKFCNNEIDVSDASRPIKDTEKAECGKNAVKYVELQVAIDGLSVVVSPQATWVDCLTVAELKKVWDAGSTVKKRSPSSPTTSPSTSCASASRTTPSTSSPSSNPWPATSARSSPC